MPADPPPAKPAEAPDRFRRPEAHLPDPQGVQAAPASVTPGQYVATDPARAHRRSPGLFQ
jgi:hypothetical protein